MEYPLQYIPKSKACHSLFAFSTITKHYVPAFKVQSTTYPLSYVAEINFSKFSTIEKISSKNSSVLSLNCKIRN